MKKSITTKMFMAILFITVITYLISFIIMNTFLDDFIIARNKVRIRELAEDFKKQYNNKSIDEYDIYKFRVDNNVEIAISDPLKRNKMFDRRFGGAGKPHNMSPIPPIIKNNNQIKDKAVIINLNKNSLEDKFIVTAVDIGKQRRAILVIPLRSIYDGIRVASRFMTNIGILSLIIGGIIIYPVSRIFTKSIKELNEVARSISKFNFSKSAEVRSKDEIGELAGSINNMSDELKEKIDELNRANKQLKEDIEKERKIEKMRKQFISDISHELKTPIAIIGGYAEGLIDSVNSDEEGRKFYSEVIIDETQKMSNLVMELLELSKLESDFYKLEKTPIDIVGILEENIKKSYHFVKEKNGEIIFESNEFSSKVYVEERSMEKVINNLLSNAVKFMNEKGKIEVKLIDKHEKIEVSVYNTGEKIKEETLDSIWNAFYKEENSRNREKGGTGLGLAIVKTILEQHKEKYGVDNLDDGVRFWFELTKV